MNEILAPSLVDLIPWVVVILFIIGYAIAGLAGMGREEK